ncbi:hypothetical protein T05_6411 [Trichinella murrelli]|uniref:Integrase catalytic domain-containing protein n=1 Tax=Trichinella murrelli TaxID=144512 RepID=A0A0V0UAZ7_9BILA|nr:hypothetical protein T05_6411 [Trichinella murrelli]
MVDGNPGQWDDMLPFVMLAYNSSVHESTGVTPAIACLVESCGCRWMFRSGTRLGVKPKGYQTTSARPESASTVCTTWRGTT